MTILQIDPNIMQTPLMWASSQGRTDVVRMLIAADVDVNYASSVGNFKGKTSLMWASSQGRLEAVTVLLEVSKNKILMKRTH